MNQTFNAYKIATLAMDENTTMAPGGSGTTSADALAASNSTTSGNASSIQNTTAITSTSTTTRV